MLFRSVSQSRYLKVSKVVVGETYKFVVNDKGILDELQMDGKVLKVNERRYKKNF